MRLGFFRDGWNIFDFLVVGVALVPASGELSVLRSMRVLRLMRLATALPAIRRVISGMFKAVPGAARSEEHTSELQSLMRISYAVFCLKKKSRTNNMNQGCTIWD